MCILFLTTAMVSHAHRPLIVEHTTLPLPAPTRYTQNPAVYPMPLPQAGNVCITPCANTGDSTIMILHGDGSVKAYRGSNGDDVGSEVPGINALADRAAAQNAKIAQISAGGSISGALVNNKWLAALLTNGKILCTDNCPSVAKATIEAWTDVVYITTGTGQRSEHIALALKRDGTVLCTDSTLASQIQAADIKGIVKISLADCTAAAPWGAFLTYDGQIRTAGSSAPAVSTEKTFVDVCCIGNYNSGCIAIREDGTYYTTNSSVQYSNLSNGYMVSAADSCAIVLKRDGTASCWGYHAMITATNVIGIAGTNGSWGTAGPLGAGGLVLTADGTVEVYSNSAQTRVTGIELSSIRSTYYSGTYDKVLHNHLWTEKPGYTIYYTTDESDPRTSSTRQVYTGTESAPGLTISRPTTLRAAAYNTATGNFEGGVRTIEWKFNYPTITPSVQPGYFVDPFQLKAEAGGYPIHYTTANREATLSDPVLGSSGISISDTTTIYMAVEFNGQAVSHETFAYTKTDTGLVVDNNGFKLEFGTGGTWSETPVWTAGTVVRAQVPVGKVTAGSLPAVLVVSVDSGQANVCRKVAFVTVTAEAENKQTVTAEVTLPGNLPAGCVAKAYLLQNFQTVRPISKMITAR